jgi:alkanesulfonate monooxygenase SsuD/methylene tetrahydromethanopterin reductase-like flavin-dependent oxidoreductase (luciferase family)
VPEGRVRHGVVLWTGERLGVTEAVDLGVAAEEAGWDGVFVPDELSAGYADPWSVLSAIAVRTTRVRLGTWITPVPHQQPWRVAHSSAAVDRLSGGRLTLGVGLGAPAEHTTFGGAYDRKELGRRYDEALDVIVGLWSGESFGYSGEFFTVQDAKLAVTPVQRPRIPIVMGCWWPNKKPFRRAARWDGIMPFWPSLLKGGVGPQGEKPAGAVKEELRSLMDYYHSLVERPGEIIVPDRPDDAYRALCVELGATWLLTTHIAVADAIRSGPKRMG